MIPVSEALREQIRSLPKKPGVYQYFDKEGKILYVGKATSLKSRVSSYFTSIDKHTSKTRVLVSKIVSLKVIIADSPYDALLLENTLIKRYQPRYNVMLRDDKTYPWICIKNERFPRVFYTRNLIKDGSEYFGPYSSMRTMHAILNFISKVYKLRNCKFNLSQENIDNKKFRVCLEYHVENCKAPCVGYQEEQDYNRGIKDIRRILKGNISDVIKDLKASMREDAENLNFELAQQTKEQIDVLTNYQLRSTVVSSTINNVDVFSIISDDKYGYINFMKIVNGCVIQAHTVEVKKKMDEPDYQLLESVIPEIRDRFNSQSKEILTSTKLELELPEIKFLVPQRGDKVKLIEMSLRNVKYFMRDRQSKQEKTDPDRRKNRILGQLRTDLRMKEMPVHIECFDNSNLQGTNPVAACVVFKDAKPAKKDYRHFNIKTVVGPDDFASMEEVVFRRYKRLLDENQPLPQLVIIDGGKGQLSSAVKSLQQLNLMGKITIVGIAKKLEEIFFPGDSFPIYIDKRSESLKLIQHLRNEAHRFGITHHRNKRSKNTIKSGLIDIPGVGPKTVDKLLRKFKSVKRIKEINQEQLAEVIGQKLAKVLKDGLSK
ncbi:MAG: excinuclease ABC subunit C [Crocinitomicaceae bacterium]|nr:excinuclease ABC subunit C [Crocinitomicaceae bacterium]|tara:strand:- start:3004 stop:4806 length:1803 start_codon:yes stop_codon:yes gene_type:complete